MRDSKIIVHHNGKQIYTEKVNINWTDKAIHLLITVEFSSGSINFYQNDVRLSRYTHDTFKSGSLFVCCDMNTDGQVAKF